ncbi:hypothetical protein [Metabacillus fastidiosus]|uniref:Uncharacterized protein n=1 Tax=Metabacillus fastidiosus TaxID=1458 RepID=A0ABU6NTT8_9BACI|nr:hypothetical protein [Metabacillus fastidiosus]MED4400113.1 hypothetical protein [Metabacillus fastidiosus]MED4452029.1 hypothetical protein [Metabacillus fastidiosus]MED4462598.1 hypothetical protein [Metabacillus fastidiosus]
MDSKVKILILFYLSILFLGSFFIIALLQLNLFQQFLRISINTKPIEPSLQYFFTGIIGASLYQLYLFITKYVNGMLTNPSEWVKYIFYPVLASGTAVVTVVLIDSGILFIEFVEGDETFSAQAGTAFLVGFGFTKIITLYKRLTSKLFSGQGVDDKDNE